MLTATITAKDQITVPAEIHKALGLKAGARIEFEEVEPSRCAFEAAQAVPVTVFKGMIAKRKRTMSIGDMRTAIAKWVACAK